MFLGIFFNCFYYYSKSIIFYNINISHDKAFFLSGKDLFTKSTFRNLEKNKRDYLFPLRFIKRVLFRILSRKSGFVVLSNCENAIYDGSLLGLKLRTSYINEHDKSDTGLFISKTEHCFGYNGIQKFELILLTLIFAPFIFLFSLFDNDKTRWGGLYFELLECTTLIYLIQKHKISKVNYFCIYEKDANINAWLLMRKQIFVNKIPSEVPLYFFNQFILSNQLSFCFAYQIEEFQAYSKTMFVDITSNWAPESILSVPPRFLDSPRKSQMRHALDIGFYSSGNWLREKLGDVDLGHNDRENEELLLKMLIQLADSKKLSLTIFLHPIEKRVANKALTDAYYMPLVKSQGIQIGPLNQASIESFDSVNLAVSLYSTLMFERIYLGFKTILAPWGYPEFPMANSPFKNICVMEPNALAEKIQYNLELSPLDFFNKNQISHYTHYLNS